MDINLQKGYELIKEFATTLACYDKCYFTLYADGHYQVETGIALLGHYTPATTVTKKFTLEADTFYSNIGKALAQYLTFGYVSNYKGTNEKELEQYIDILEVALAR